MVDQMGDDFGVGLACEGIALGLQLGAQLVVVFDDAVVDERDATGRRLARAGTVREVRVRVVDCRCAMRRPARVSDAGAALHLVMGDAGLELGHARGTPRAPQFAALMDRDTAGVVAAVLEPLQPFDENRNDVPRADGADDATHDRVSSRVSNGWIVGRAA